MKRMILAATLAVAALGLTARPAEAEGPFFNCLGCRKCGPCWHKCGAEFLVRQYNAFTPVCMGSLYCDGMAPMTFGTCCPPATCGHGQMAPLGPAACGGPAGCTCCNGNGTMGQYPPVAGMYPGAPMFASPGMYPGAPTMAAPGMAPGALPLPAGPQPMRMPQAGMYPYPPMMGAPGYPAMAMMPGAAPGYGMPGPVPGPTMPLAAMPAMPQQ